VPAVSPLVVKSALCRRDYGHFVRAFWSTIIPEPLQWSWYIDLACREVQECYERVFARLPYDHYTATNQPPGTTKPVWDGHRVMMADGRWKRLRDVRVGDSVVGKSGRSCRVSAVHVQGELPVVRLTTYGGRDLYMAPDHPVLTSNGWVQAGQIVPDDVVALLHRPKLRLESDRRDEEFTFAGYLIGDGSVGHNACSMTCGTPEYIQDIIRCGRALGFACKTTTDKNGVARINFRVAHDETRLDPEPARGPGGRGFYQRRYGPRSWCREIGIAGKNSYTKIIPDFVWGASDRQVALFLSAYFHCDGCVSYRDKGKRNITVNAITVSRKLADGLQKLFLRLGIAMKVRRRESYHPEHKRAPKNYVTYAIETTDQDAASRFAEKIPLLGPKAAKLRDFQPRRRTFDQDYWPDRIKSVEEWGTAPCRCLMVDDDESFVIEGVVVHNSIVHSVMSLPWAWTRMPEFRLLGASYSDTVAQKLSLLARDVIKSDLYKSLFPEIKLRDDMDSRANFMNTAGGERFAVGSKGTVTGAFHGHALVIDDALSPQQSISPTETAGINHWMVNTVLNRKVDKDITYVDFVGQRLSKGDATEKFLEVSDRVKHIRLPATDDFTISPPELRRHYVDGLLDPKRLSRQVLAEERKKGEVYYAAQFGQDPKPAGGGKFKTDMLRVGVPPDRFPVMVRSWDKAASVKTSKLADPAYTVGTLMAKDDQKRVWVLEVIRVRLDSFARERLIKRTAQRDTRAVEIVIEQEPGSGGKDSAVGTVRRLEGYRVHVVKPTGNKELRAEEFSVQVNAGNVWLPAGVKSDNLWIGWAKPWVEELDYWPFSGFLDQVDSAAQGFNRLWKGRIRVGPLKDPEPDPSTGATTRSRFRGAW
jgi:predicted phage terminase large subunit-like protein